MISRRGRYNCRDGFCGALDCETCYGMSAVRYRREMAHEEHTDPKIDIEDCPECQEPIPHEEDAWERKLRRKRVLDEGDADYAYDPPMMRDPQ